MEISCNFYNFVKYTAGLTCYAKSACYQDETQCNQKVKAGLTVCDM